jgi:hypothetical protein
MMLRPSQPSALVETMTFALCVGISLLMLVLPETMRFQITERLSTVLTEPYHAVVRYGQYVMDVQRQAETLQARQIELDLKAATLQRALRDQERQEIPGGLPAGFSGSLLPCQVVARKSGRRATMIMIRSTSAMNWQRFQPVMTEHGLLGRIHHFSGPRKAWVELLSAPDMTLGCEVERNGLVGVLRSYGDKFVLDLVSRDETDLLIGDRIITSGIAEVPEQSAREEGWALTPRGLPVGVVSRISRSATRLFLDIEVKPLATFHTNATVFLVTDASGPGKVAGGRDRGAGAGGGS